MGPNRVFKLKDPRNFVLKKIMLKKISRKNHWFTNVGIIKFLNRKDLIQKTLKRKN